MGNVGGKAQVGNVEEVRERGTDKAQVGNIGGGGKGH